MKANASSSNAWVQRCRPAREPGAVDSNEQGDCFVQGNLFGEIAVAAFYSKMLEKHGGTLSHRPVLLTSLDLVSPPRRDTRSSPPCPVASGRFPALQACATDRRPASG